MYTQYKVNMDTL